MPEVAREMADLPSVMRVVLHEIRDHVDGPPRHPRHTRLTSGKCRLEQAREILRGPPERAPCVRPGRALAIERGRSWPRAAQARKRPADALDVRDDCRD